jgi:peptidoglycan hydrolase CwlO-like protein/mono/diheme cytochrome c family protein
MIQFGLLIRVLSFAVGLLLPLSLAVAQEQEKVTYDDHIASILRQRCSSCHGPTTKKADLDVTTYLTLMQGGASGGSIEAGDASSSYLFALVNREAEPYMPLNADKIPDAEIDLLRRWIDGGALENKGSKAAKTKPKMSLAVDVTPGKRPDVIPMPPRLVLEPHHRTSKPPMARSLATSPWAPLAAVTSQRQVLLYNTATLELVGVFPFPEGQPNVVRFSRDGRLLLAGGGQPAASGQVVVWDLTTGERLFEVGDELDVVLAADISADNKQIALGGPQRLVRVYSTETGEKQFEIAKHTDWVLSVEFSPDGVLLGTADRNGGLQVWEAKTGREYLTLNGHTGAITALSWRGDSNLLASGSEDGTVRLWEPENGAQVKNWNAKTAVLSLEFARDGRLVTCGRDQITRLWDQEGTQLLETAAIGDVAVSATLCDESLRVVAGGWNGSVQVYKCDDAAAIGMLATNPPALDERLAAAQQRLQEKTTASAPTIEAGRKAAEELAAVESSLATAQQAAAGLQSQIDAVSSQAGEVQKSRNGTDTERTNLTAELAKLQAAQPPIAEALRHLTEALGKLPENTDLLALQKQLSDKLSALNARTTELHAKIAELTNTVSGADGALKEANGRLETLRTELVAATERATGLQSQLTTLKASQDPLLQAAKTAESEVAQAQADVARWKDEIAFRDRIAAVEAKLTAAQKTVGEREAEVSKANEQLAVAKSTVDAATAKLTEATTGVDQLKAEIREARRIK